MSCANCSSASKGRLAVSFYQGESMPHKAVIGLEDQLAHAQRELDELRAQRAATAAVLQVMHARFSVNGRMAKGPEGRKCCTARPWCGCCSWTVLTMPTWR